MVYTTVMPANGQYQTTAHGEFIRNLINNDDLWGTYTRQQLADLTSEEVGYQVSTEQVRNILRSGGNQKFTKNCSGKMATDSSLKGENLMAEPTEAQKRALLEECSEHGIDVSNVKHFWHKSKRISMFVVAQNRPTYEQIRDEHIAEMLKHSPKYPAIKRKKETDGHLLVIDPADVHIGKLAVKSETGYAYDMDIAVQMVQEGVDGILQKASGFPIDKIVLIIGNDIMHVDNPFRTTTAGTRQDTDGMWHENFITARKLYVMLIERLMQFADVDVVFNPSNHDYASGFMLADAVSCWFNKSKNVNFDCDIIHRKYYQYGDNMIVTTHGDGAKFGDMPLLMASEQPKMWADTRHRYAYVHHLHHKQKHQFMASKDFPGITLEVMRSPSASDGWHHRNGYTGAPQAIEGFIHHKTGGQVARLSHIF